MEVQGNITWVGEKQTGTSQSGKQWSKKPFEVEYIGGQYPKRVVFDCFDTNIMDKLQVGLIVQVKFDITTHEYNGRRFNNLQIWTNDGLHAVGKVNGGQQQAQQQQSQQQASAQPAPQQQQNNNNNGGGDNANELPF